MNLLIRRFGKRTAWLFLIKIVFPWQINYPEFMANLWLHGCYWSSQAVSLCLQGSVCDPSSVGIWGGMEGVSCLPVINRICNIFYSLSWLNQNTRQLHNLVCLSNSSKYDHHQHKSRERYGRGVETDAKGNSGIFSGEVNSGIFLQVFGNSTLRYILWMFPMSPGLWF